MSDPWAVYDLLQARAADAGPVQEIVLGLVWTLCRSERGTGLAMTPAGAPRTLPWSGTLAGRPLTELAAWLRAWDPHAASIGLAAVNAVLNRLDNPLLARALPLAPRGPGNLAVFEHFLPQIAGRRVVVIGRYPGLDAYAGQMDLNVLERQPSERDLPDPACEYLLPAADWVFLTASSLANKTFPRLAALSRNAITVLMGPGTPWVGELTTFGIDYLAGVEVLDHDALRRTLAEGGGVRLFEGPVRYRLVDLRADDRLPTPSSQPPGN
ncbi:MAG: DUF364 domain-containing protein [Porticoccaceae bacterium]